MGVTLAPGAGWVSPIYRLFCLMACVHIEEAEARQLTSNDGPTTSTERAE